MVLARLLAWPEIGGEAGGLIGERKDTVCASSRDPGMFFFFSCCCL